MSKSTQQLQGNLVLDTGVVLEYLLGSSSCGERIKEYFTSLGRNEKAHLSLYSVSEIYYVLCRMKSNEDGSKFALEKLKELLKSNALSVHYSLELSFKTGEMKCERSLSIVDCAALALAESLNIPACFVKEKELEREISKKSFRVSIFLVEA